MSFIILFLLYNCYDQVYFFFKQIEILPFKLSITKNVQYKGFTQNNIKQPFLIYF